MSFSKVLSTEQQLFISANLDKLSDFFQEADVKEAICIMADAFIKKTTK